MRAASEAEFKGKMGQTLVVRGAEGTAILVGSGKDLAPGIAAENLGGHLFSALGESWRDICFCPA